MTDDLTSKPTPPELDLQTKPANDPRTDHPASPEQKGSNTQEKVSGELSMSEEPGTHKLVEVLERMLEMAKAGEASYFTGVLFDEDGDEIKIVAGGADPGLRAVVGALNAAIQTMVGLYTGGITVNSAPEKMN